MGVDWSVTYFVVFLQVFVGLILVRTTLEPRLAIRILGALFLFNAGVSAIMGLPREAAIWLASDEGWITRAFRALDAPTGWLLLAFLAARSARPGAGRTAGALVVVGIVLAIAEFPLHRQMVDSEHILRAIPLYAGLGIGSYVLAAGRPWERWLALALIARGLYWGTAGVLEVGRTGLGDAPHLFVNRLGLVALAILVIAASVRLARQEERPPGSVIIPVLVVGPAAALIETGVSLALPSEHVFRYGSLVLVNLITLGLVRPLLVLGGVAPAGIIPVFGRTALTAGIATLSTLMVGPLELAGGRTSELVTTYSFGLCVGLLALAALEAAPALQVQGMLARSSAAARLARPPAPVAEPPRPPRPQPPAPTAPASLRPAGGAAESVVLMAPQALAPPVAPPPAPPASTVERPQWQTILVALRGSAAPEGATPVGEERLTQRALVERTGVRASRVSTIVRELNEGAVARLDAHLPGWRQRPEARGVPDILRQYRGAVAGVAGVWVYYRLTPLGEALAEALEEPEFRERSHAP